MTNLPPSLPATLSRPDAQQIVDALNKRLGEAEQTLNSGNAFLRLATAGERKIAFGTGTFTFSASNLSGEVTVTHGLGTTPAIVVGSASDAALSFAVKSIGATTFKAQSFDAFGSTTGSFTFYWLAIG